MATIYREGIIETNKGQIITVSVPSDVELDARGYIKDPQSIFEIGSFIVVTNGIEPGEDSPVAIPNPARPRIDTPKTSADPKPVFGPYRIKGFISDGRVVIERTALGLLWRKTT